MNPSPQHHDTAVDEQAAYWAARLEGEVLEANERAELDAWLARSAAHRSALSEYCQFSADLEEQLPKLVASGAVKMPPHTASRPMARWSFLQLGGIVVAAAAAVGVGLWVSRAGSHVEHFAPAAERTTQSLADGTRVELNANTALRFEIAGGERHARLTGGEAIFIVTKDPSRPFFVDTPTGAVRVTGTAFNVRADPSTGIFEVTVVEGSVEVRPTEMSRKTAEGAFALTAHDQLSAQHGQVMVKTLTPAALDNALAWRQGQIVFVDVPLREAAARFAQYHGRRIEVAPEVADERVGGQYALADLTGFLKAVEATLPVKLGWTADGATYFGPPDAR